MKYAVLALALLMLVPAGIAIRSMPRVSRVLIFALGTLPFVWAVNVNLVSHEWYRGPDRGFEFTLIDLVAWTLWLALPKTQNGTPYRLVQAIYLLVCLLTLALSTVPLYTAFSVWKLVRMYFFVAALARVCANFDHIIVLLKGLAWGVVFQTAWSLKLRYLDGAYQVAGTFDHQNSLGMAISTVVPILFAWLLKTKGRLPLAAVAGGTLCIVLTLSRGSMVTFAVSMATVYVASILRGLSVRKVAVSVLGLGAGVALLGASLDQIWLRFQTAPAESAQSRTQFVHVARSMLADHPFGVGLNAYAHWIERHYADALQLPLRDTGVAHHIYWLTLAELGYLGLVAFLVLTVAPIGAAVLAMLRGRGDFRGDLALGCLAGLTAMSFQGLLEWVARQTHQMYLFWMISVIAISLLRSLRNEPNLIASAEPGRL